MCMGSLFTEMNETGIRNKKSTEEYDGWSGSLGLACLDLVWFNFVPSLAPQSPLDYPFWMPGF